MTQTSLTQAAPSTPTYQTRQLRASRNIVWTVIRRQAGTLGKALAEAAMNSIDAGATFVEVTMEATKVVIKDNGRGFENAEQVSAWFEEFGFEHEPNSRQIGEFGMGRAQLWNFCSTHWRTRDFDLDVDVQTRGLDYLFGQGLEHVDGMVIEGAFYTPQTTADIVATQRDLSDLLEFVSVPCTFNGKAINRPPAGVKWTFETDDGWFLIQPAARALTVYNLGVKVTSYPAYRWGVGGIVVTKPGVKLALNTARTDIIVSECKVWKRVQKAVQGKSDDAVKRSPRPTEQQLANIATRFIAGELSYEEVAGYKLITDVLGKSRTLRKFNEAWGSAPDHPMTWVPRNEADAVAERSHTSGQAFVLSEKTMARFDVVTAKELLQCLQGTTGLVWQGVAIDDWREACKHDGDDHAEVPRKEWKKHEVVAIKALECALPTLSYLLSEIGAVESGYMHRRELRVGVSTSAQAWTDGTTLVWFDRDLLKAMHDGLEGITHVVMVLLHELLHEGPSSGTHVHDAEFYENFEKAAAGYLGRGIASVGLACKRVLATYLKLCVAEGLNYTQWAMNDLTATEKTERLAA